MAYGFIKPFYFRACNFENIITVRGTVTIFIGCPPGSADGSYIVFDNTGFDFMVGIQVGMPWDQTDWVVFQNTEQFFSAGDDTPVSIIKRGMGGDEDWSIFRKVL